MTFNNGARVAHKLNPLNWRGVITWVQVGGKRVKVRLTSGTEVEVPASVLKMDCFTDEEVKAWHESCCV